MYPLTYLFKRLRVKENPSKLNHLGRVLRHVNAMLVARGSYVDDDVTIDVELGGLLGRHFAVRAPCGLQSASRQCLLSPKGGEEWSEASTGFRRRPGGWA